MTMQIVEQPLSRRQRMGTPSERDGTCSACGAPVADHFDTRNVAVGCPQTDVTIRRSRRDRAQGFIDYIAEAFARHHFDRPFEQLSPRDQVSIRKRVTVAYRSTEPASVAVTVARYQAVAVVTGKRDTRTREAADGLFDELEDRLGRLPGAERGRTA